MVVYTKTTNRVFKSHQPKLDYLAEYYNINDIYSLKT